MVIWTKPAIPAWLLMLAFCGAAFSTPVRAEDCIATYDKQGRVTGQYCPDGTSTIPKGARAARAPSSVDPESNVPPEARQGGTGSAGRANPKGVEIQCGKWKSQNGGCRGIFTILK
jgi:hypothetical protein